MSWSSMTRKKLGRVFNFLGTTSVAKRSTVFSPLKDPISHGGKDNIVETFIFGGHNFEEKVIGFSRIISAKKYMFLNGKLTDMTETIDRVSDFKIDTSSGEIGPGQDGVSGPWANFGAPK